MLVQGRSVGWLVGWLGSTDMAAVSRLEVGCVDFYRRFPSLVSSCRAVGLSVASSAKDLLYAFP